MKILNTIILLLILFMVSFTAYQVDETIVCNRGPEIEKINYMFKVTEAVVDIYELKIGDFNN